MTTNTEQTLIERLKARYTVRDEHATLHPLVNPDGPEAAERIAELEREIERLRKAGLAYRDTRNEYITKFKAAEREIERLRSALEPFAKIKADDGDTFAGYPDDCVIRCEVSAGELRAARTALNGERP